MFPVIEMPWWAWGYLLFIVSMFTISWSMTIVREQCDPFASAMSLLTMCCFVAGFYNSDVVTFLGWFILPMFVLGVFWEYKRYFIEKRIGHQMLLEQPEITDGDIKLFLNAAFVFNLIMVAPAYLMGFALCFEVLGV